jgi:cell division protein FtsB
MKKLLFILVLLFGYSFSVFAQPATKQDVEQLRKDIEQLKKDIEQFKAYVDLKIEQLKTYVDLKIEALSNDIKGEIKALNTKVDTKIEAVSGQIAILMWMIGILAGLIGLLVALPQVLDFLRGRKETQARLEKLEAEIVELKARPVAKGDKG